MLLRPVGLLLNRPGLVTINEATNLFASREKLLPVNEATIC